MGNFNFVNLLIFLVILYFVGLLIYKIVIKAKKLLHNNITSNKKIKELEKRISELEEKR
jgi:hypothetical protein